MVQAKKTTKAEANTKRPASVKHRQQSKADSTLLKDHRAPAYKPRNLTKASNPTPVDVPATWAQPGPVGVKHRQQSKANSAILKGPDTSAPKPRKLTKASVPKLVEVPAAWTQPVEPSTGEIHWGPELPTQEQIGRLHGRGTGRELTSWKENRLLERLLVTIDIEAKSAGLDLPWAKIAHRLNPGSGPQAVQQYLDRTYNSLLDEGHVVPPPYRKHQSFPPEIRGYVRDDTAEAGVRPIPYWEAYQNPPAPRKGRSRTNNTTSMAEQSENAFVEDNKSQAAHIEAGQNIGQAAFYDESAHADVPHTMITEPQYAGKMGFGKESAYADVSQGSVTESFEAEVPTWQISDNGSHKTEAFAPSDHYETEISSNQAYGMPQTSVSQTSMSFGHQGTSTQPRHQYYDEQQHLHQQQLRQAQSNEFSFPSADRGHRLPGHAPAVQHGSTTWAESFYHPSDFDDWDF